MPVFKAEMTISEQ